MIQKFYAGLSEKEKKVFYAAMGVIVLALFDALFLRPVQNKLKGMNEEIREQTNNIKRDLRILSYKEKILVERQKLWEYYPKEQQTPDQIKAAFLQRIETVATEAKINLVKVSPSKEEEKKGFKKYYADLDCNGLLEDIVKFMHLIDSTPDLLKVVKVNMTGKPNVKEVTANMTVVKVIPDPKAIWTESELRDIADGKEVDIKNFGSSGSSGGGSGRGGSGGSGSSSSGKGSSGSGASGAGQSSISAGSGTGGGGQGGSGGEGGEGGAGGEGGTGGDGGGGGEGGGGGATGGSGGSAGGGGGAGGSGVGGAGVGGTGGAPGSGIPGGGGTPVAGGAAGSGADGKRFELSTDDGTPSSSGSASTGKVSKEREPEEKPKPKKSPILPNAAVPSTGERVQVKGITDLWNDFWGIKPKPVEAPEINDKDVNWDEVEEDQNRKNVWEKMLNK